MLQWYLFISLFVNKLDISKNIEGGSNPSLSLSNEEERMCSYLVLGRTMKAEGVNFGILEPRTVQVAS